jgi:hypothetical protein
VTTFTPRAEADLRYRYNLSASGYTRLLASQSGGCAICGIKPGSKRLAVDHDHACCPGRRSCGGCIRGLLCKRCNFYLLGQICKETSKGRVHAVSVLWRAIHYLNEPPAKGVISGTSETVNSGSAEVVRRRRTPVT